MGTYYITPTGLSQKDLVAFLKDLETAFGGTNTTNYITTTTTADVTKSYDMNVAVSQAISAGSTFASAISAQLSAGVKEVQIPSLIMSYNDSIITSEGGSAGASTGSSAGASAGEAVASSAASLAAASAVTSHVARSLPASAVTSYVALSVPSSAGSLALSQGTSGGVSAVTSVVITPEAAAASVVSAGQNLVSGVSAMISSGAGGGHISFMSHLCSKLVSASI